MENIQNITREKLTKSDDLNFIKEISNSMTKEEFLEYSSKAMKTAYDLKRLKSVKYMLSFYEYNEPDLLFKIHVQIMMHNKITKFHTAMFKILCHNFSFELLNDITNQYISNHKYMKDQNLDEKKSLLSTVYLGEKLTKNKETKITKKMKI